MSPTLFIFLSVLCINNFAFATESNDVALESSHIEINLSCKNLTFLPDAETFSPFTKLLNVSLNNLTVVTNELKQLSNLEVLILRFNRLTTLKFLPELCNIRRLDASRNVISTLDGPLATCVQLESLNLTVNEISTLPVGVFANMNRLRVLYIAGNKLSTLAPDAFKGVWSLERLRLNRNQLRTLPDGVFAGLHALRYLDVSFNNLTDLPPLKDCCDVMQGAYVRNNSIAWLSEESLRGFLRGDASTNRDLSGNPLQARALAWAARDPHLRLLVHDDDCACGLLHHEPSRASLKLCVKVTCGAGAPVANWVAAVKALNNTVDNSNA